MIKLRNQKTVGKLTAAELVNSAAVIKTQSNDYLIRVGEYDLDLTDDNELCVSGFGTGIFVMNLNCAEIEKMNGLHTVCEQSYQADQAG